jgi:hypothetical protein
MPRKHRPALFLAVVGPPLWWSLTAVGCSRDISLVPVRGTVSLDGGPMPGPGTIYFTPITADDGMPLRPSMADFGPDGRYVAGTFGDGEGLIPGQYLVAVTCWKAVPSEEEPGVSFIPARYQNPASSGLDFTVAAGRRMTQDFPLTSGPR